jgi:hypothetical protein
MAVIRVGPLPEGALDAAAVFHADVLPRIRAELGQLDPTQDGEGLVIVFPSAPHDHRAWRLAAIQDLARAATPLRVNGIGGEDEAAITRSLAFLATAPGITGQILTVDGKSGEND